MEFKNVKEASEAYDKLFNESNKQAESIGAKEALISELRDELADRDEKIEKLDDQIKDYQEKVNGFEAKVDELIKALNEVRAQQSVGGNKAVFLHKKTDTEYQIDGKSFSLDGKEITAKDILENENLQDHLVEIGAGFLSEVERPE
jgi:uncharacterized coiled-coil DUF342 family protein